MSRTYYPTIETQTEEQKEKERKYQQEFSNRKAQGFICGNCKFFKENAVLHDERRDGRCLKSINGVKNPSTIFDGCGGPRTVYASEIHRCFTSTGQSACKGGERYWPELFKHQEIYLKIRYGKTS